MVMGRLQLFLVLWPILVLKGFEANVCTENFQEMDTNTELMSETLLLMSKSTEEETKQKEFPQKKPTEKGSTDAITSVDPTSKSTEEDTKQKEFLQKKPTEKGSTDAITSVDPTFPFPGLRATPPATLQCKCNGNYETTTVSSTSRPPLTTSKPNACKCPAFINIGWLDKKPFISTMDSKNNTTQNMTGIFSDVLKGAVRICCSEKRGCTKDVVLNYSKQAEQDERSLSLGLLDKRYDVIMPMHSRREAGSYATYPYIHVMDSPGVMLVTRRRGDDVIRHKVVKILQDTWPVVIVTFLLTVVAGIAIWALDTSRNPKEFPRPFLQGALDGCWWAFVTMTTVGYGDHAPKSFFARLFGVVWISIGLVICSILTATLIAALTTLSIKEADTDIFGEQVGVVDEFGYKVGMENGANNAKSSTIKDAIDTLLRKDVEGLLLEMYTGVSFLSTEDRLASVEIKRFIRMPFSYGIVATKKKDHQWAVFKNCLGFVLKHKRGEVLEIVANHTFHKSTKPVWEILKKEASDSSVIRLIDPNSKRVRLLIYLLVSAITLMCAVGIWFEVKRRRTSRLENPEADECKDKIHPYTFGFGKRMGVMEDKRKESIISAVV